MPGEFADALVLARLQFAFTVSFHIVFPAFTIGLASFLVVLEGLWLRTGQAAYLALYKYWSRIFALSFGMGVVSGIVMSYQFGTNWGPFADRTGPVLGPLLAYEVLSAFFLEAGFLGVMLFGMDRVGRGLHFLATALVGAGTLFSAFWILSASSWMHTPAGFIVMEDGQFVADDWWALVFNPSFPYRFVHMVLAAYLTTAFVVGAVGALHLLRDRANAHARIMLSMAMWMAALVAPLQLVAGDLHGLNTLEHQPAKIAAMEGHWHTQSGAPLILFAWPDPETQTNLYEVAVPKLGSFILTHDWDGEVRGLTEWDREDRPDPRIVFWSFRVMVAVGLSMIAAGLMSLYLRARGGLYDRRWFLRILVIMGPAGFIAVLAGWITTEVGRQPWVVYGLMRTADAVSPIGAVAVGGSLAAFVAVYFAVFGAGIYYLLKMMAQAPTPLEAGSRPDRPKRAAAMSPFGAAPGADGAGESAPPGGSAAT